MKQDFDFWQCLVVVALSAYAGSEMCWALYFLYYIITLKLYYTTTPQKPHISAHLRAPRKVRIPKHLF